MELVMPMNYEVLDQEEMMYLDGGYSNYRGWSGWNNITKMMADVTGWAATTSALMKAAVGFAATGIGIALSILSIVGANAAWVSTLWNTGAVATAIFLMVKSNGYRAKGIGFFSWSINFVKPL